MIDIVDELRAQRWDRPPDSLCDEAASEIVALRDEIERLREVAEAADQYHDVVCDPDHCRLCKALQAWREAR